MVNPQRFLFTWKCTIQGSASCVAAPPQCIGREENPPKPGAEGLQLTFSRLGVDWRDRVLSPQFVVKRGDHALPPILGAGSDAFPSTRGAGNDAPKPCCNEVAPAFSLLLTRARAPMPQQLWVLGYLYQPKPTPLTGSGVVDCPGVPLQAAEWPQRPPVCQRTSKREGKPPQ